MKILINATCIETTRATGIERFALHIVRELCRIDPSVTVVASEPLTGIPNVEIPRELTVFHSLLGRWEFYFRAVWDQTGFRSTVARHNPDLIFFPIQDGLVYPPVRQIVTVHDLHYLHFGGMMSECRHEIGWFRQKIYRQKLPKILSSSAAVITVSESTKQDLVLEFGVKPDRIHVIHNGYDEAHFRIIDDQLTSLSRYGLQPGTYFLFVGSILRHKNIIRLVEAFSHQKDENISLVIAGVCKDAAYLREIREAAARQGIREDRVRYLDYVPDDDLPCLYNGALAFVLPSLHEGFGVPIVEAMACGTPVITSNCSAMPEVAGNAAILVDPYSVESIAAAMSEIRCNPQRAEILKNAGLERCKSFTWSHSARKLYDVCTMVSRL